MTMRHTTYAHRRLGRRGAAAKLTFRRRGFTLVEVILSSLIMALLMIAVGAAVMTATTGFGENEKTSRAMQGARATLERITRQLRTAEDADFSQTTEQGTWGGEPVTMDVTTLTITAPRDGSQLEEVRYVHRIPHASLSGGKLYYYYKKPGQELTTSTLAMLGEEDDVDEESFDVTIVTEGSVAQSAKVQFTLDVGGRTFQFAAGVALRGEAY